MKQNIRNINSKGELNGYQERYNVDGKLAYRGNYKNNIDIGYQEYHFLVILVKYLKQTHFFIR